MALVNWRVVRTILAIIAGISGALLLGIAGNLGFPMSYEFFGFELGTIAGIANIVAIYLLYKAL